MSRSSNNDRNSKDSASDSRSSQSKRGTRKDNDSGESSRPKNGDEVGNDFHAGKDDKRRGYINSSDSRDNEQQTYRMDKRGSPKISDGALGTVDAICKTGSKHSDKDAQVPAVEVKDHQSAMKRPTESPPKTEMDVARDCEQVSSTLQGQKSSFFDTVAFGLAATAPGQHDRALHSTSGSKPSRQAGIFDDEEGPTVILDEDSMQSVDYERNMLNQDFNCDTVDILETVEEDDEDVL